MLMDYLPPYYSDSAVFKALLKAFTEEINRNKYAISDLEKQLFIDTSTWGLSVWERQMGICADVAKSYAERREIVKAKMRGAGTCTIEMIKNTALAYTNAEVEVIEDNPHYTFAVKFISEKGVPADIDAFKATMEQIKPAHLVYTLEYTYTNWGELQPRTWGACREKSWETIRLT